ncbi:hypothetical protein [Immundisolibacter sp.]|uniref:hypothetical protein n=1 Tax=Immundisolibacter sp. TaxID=1934948 RepID=UPI002635F94B|nr:hypothetical protein [Immundisolibacter sp.]MDD3651745.1 hypothetical protein [Immundisolibacter sp.]
MSRRLIVRGFVEELGGIREHEKVMGKPFGNPKLALTFGEGRFQIGSAAPRFE